MQTLYRRKFILSIFLLNLFNMTVAFPQEAKKRLPVIHVSEQAPDFVLNNLSGKEIKLSAFRGKKKVVLVFYRGWVGYW